MKHFLDITAALSDETRLRALLALRLRELCLCQVTELLELASSTVSKHLSLLKQAGLVESRKEGRWIHYRLVDDDRATPEALAAIQWARAALARDARVLEDTKRLKAILCEDPEDICKRQNERRACCSSAPATRVEARWRKDSRAPSRAT